MKFSIALGLLFAGLAHCQQADPQQIKVDSFLRQNQHLKPSAELISIKQNGDLSTATYKDGPMNMKFDVRSQNDQMRIVGIQQTATFSGNYHSEPLAIQDVSQNIEIKLQPLPLIMPQWNIQQNGELKMRNVFESDDKQLKEMQQERKNIQQIMEQKRLEMQQRFNKNFEMPLQETQLLGGKHDYNQATNVQIEQTVIGGDHESSWVIEVQNDADHPIVGGGDHDYNQATFEFLFKNPLLGADDFDKEWKEFEDHPIIGGDDHDNWQSKHHKNLKEQNQVRTGKHHMWRHKKGDWQGSGSFEGKEHLHRGQMDWQNRSFTNDEIAPFLNEKLPDLMEGSEILSIKNKGFIRGKGFPLTIQMKNKEGQVKNVSAYFKVRKHEFLIDKVENANIVDSNLQTGKQLVSRFVKGLEQNLLPPVEIDNAQKKTQKHAFNEVENLIAPKFISESKMSTLLGGSSDPDHDPEFMKLAKEIQLNVNNHIQEAKEIYQIPLLGGQNDPDHSFNKIPLLGGQSDLENSHHEAKKEEQGFDVSSLPLPGGETDIDHKLGLELINNIMESVKDISEQDIEDIDEAEEGQQKDEKLQLKIK